VDGYDEVRVQVDRRGMLLGVTIVHDCGGVGERVRPLGVGPFDTLAEVAEIAGKWLTVQQTLW
jgi:hypothetical protein